MRIEKYKKQKIPDKSVQQKEVNRAKCATLCRKYRDREWILDAESYFKKTHSNINGNDNFYLDNIDFAPAKVKFRRKHKYFFIFYDFLCDNLIHHADKVDNPADSPEVRPIEDFWSILKPKFKRITEKQKNLPKLQYLK